ncbi:MAG: T9SS type A sorting domain-containing protein, partial [Fidelibacterota bacterium]
DDLASFSSAWYWSPVDTTRELGPATGEVPDLTPQPDGVFDFEDLMVFIQMWNWSFMREGYFSTELFSLGSEEDGVIELRGRFRGYQREGSSLIKLTIHAKEDLNFYSAKLLLSFEADRLEVISVDRSEDFNKDDLFLHFLNNNGGLIEINLGKFNRSERGGLKSDPLAIITFAPRAISKKSNFTFRVGYDIRNKAGNVIKRGSFLRDLFMSQQLPRSYYLGRNFPNPFNILTTIIFNIPERVKVSLIVYNLLGEEVSVLVNEIKNPGFYKVSWGGRDKLGKEQPSGIYFYTLRAGDFKRTGKMIMLK